MPFFQRRQRQHRVPGLDDDPPPPVSPPPHRRPDGAAVARERVEQVSGVTPRATAVGERYHGDDDGSSSTCSSSSGSEVGGSSVTRPLAPSASDEGGGVVGGASGSSSVISLTAGPAAAVRTTTTMAPLSVDGGKTTEGKREKRSSAGGSTAAGIIGAGTPGGWARRPSSSSATATAGAVETLPSQHNHRDHRHHEQDQKHHKFSWREFAYMCGPGLLMAVAYLDPGNLEADIQAGAHVGFSLLWFVALAFACGFAFQCMTARLGVVTGRDLAAVAGGAYPRGARVVLWLLLEAALVGADIQETIGSAIAIALLSGGKVPLWGGCLLITAAAFVVLLLERCGARHLEAVFGGLIAMQGVSAGVNYFQARVPQRDVLRGLFVPKMPSSAVPFAVGALGALVMPHNIYFASALASTSRPDVVPKGTAVAPSPATTTSSDDDAQPSTPTAVRGVAAGGDDSPVHSTTPIVAAAAAAAAAPPSPSGGGKSPERSRQRTPFVAAETTTTGLSHSRTRVLLRYARLEAGVVLVGAFCINLFVVCLFAHGFYGTPEANDVGLASAGQYLGERFGALFKYLWAVGLLASGLSATITLTYAGQIVMAGLLRFEVASWRRLLGTRAVALIPTVTIAAVFEGTGSSRRFDGMNQLLNVLQAMVLPFSLVPVIALTASPAVIPHAPFRTKGLLLAFACCVAALVAAIDGYLIVDFVKELNSGEGGGGVGTAAWIGLAALLGAYYSLIGYFAVGPARVSRAAAGAARAAAGAAKKAAAQVKGTRWKDPGAMMEVHL